VLNLISNAIKFTDEGRISVTVSAAPIEPPDGPPGRAEPDGAGKVALKIAVSDTGIGLTPADCTRLFAEFEQAEPAVRRQAGGTGLGLAISQRLAHAMGGAITVSSEPDRGSVFTVDLILPVGRGASDGAAAARAQHCPQTKPHAAPLAQSGSVSNGNTAAAVKATRGRILVAEDNDINALLTSRILTREGCEAVRARSGVEAVEAYRASLLKPGAAFDLILMDLLMPRLDGLEAAAAIRELAAALGQPSVPPMIAVTANAFPEDRERCMAAGMDGYLAKPFEPADMTALLQRWLPQRWSHASATPATSRASS
jgi:two-component system, sensor histidine kinase